MVMDGRRAGAAVLGQIGLPGGGFGFVAGTTAPGRTAVRDHFKAAFPVRRPFRQYDGTDLQRLPWHTIPIARFMDCHP